MGGLAYMTGPLGRPLRAGSSVVDIMGGSYGVIGVLTALYEREKTGKGQFVIASLYESTAFLMGQHMALSAVSGKPVPPMPSRVSTWGVYDIFKTQDQGEISAGTSPKSIKVLLCSSHMILSLSATRLRQPCRGIWGRLGRRRVQL